MTYVSGFRRSGAILLALDLAIAPRVTIIGRSAGAQPAAESAQAKAAPAYDNASGPPAGRALLFESDRDGRGAVHSVGVDGTERQRRTRTAVVETTDATTKPSAIPLVAVSCCASTEIVRATPLSPSGSAAQPQAQSRASQPRVSPDGRHIAFVARMANGESGLYVVDTNGMHLRRLTDGHGEMPAWSPDGSKVVFTRQIDERTQPLMIINAAGSSKHAISTGYPKNQVACWSPNGRQFVLTMDGPHDFGIFTMRINGSDQKKLGRGMQPVWSPDGKHIAFAGKADPQGPLRIFVVNPDGTHERQVSTGNGLHEYPAWSWDSKRIAYFASARTATGKSNAVIRLVNVDGSGDVEMGKHSSPYLDEIPSCFPDGKRLAIQSDRDGAMGIYIIDLNGNTLARVAP